MRIAKLVLFVLCLGIVGSALSACNSGCCPNPCDQPNPCDKPNPCAAPCG